MIFASPGGQLQHPTSWPVPRHELRDNQILATGQRDGPPANIGRIDEVYLRLFDVDLDSTESIMAFVDRYGILGVRRRRFREFVTILRFPQMLKRFQDSWPTWVAHEYERGGEQMSYGESLDEFRFGARLLVDMTNAYRVLSSAEGVENVSFESPLLLDQSNNGLGDFLARGLSGGLEVFHPYVAYLPDDHPDETPMPEPWQREANVFPWTLYTICCLELYNHIARSNTHRTCQNEPCGRMFVYQRKRTQGGRNRSGGLKYCSPECRGAQNSRRYRRSRRDRTSNPGATTAASRSMPRV